MKYALIGCARIATNHVKAVLNNNLEFVAACDIELDNIETLYCEKCKEDIYEEELYESRREQTYKNNNRRKSLEHLLQ